jgi:hypothetical protein
MKIEFGKEVDVKFLNRPAPIKMTWLDCDRVVFLPDQKTVLANVNGIGRVVIAEKEGYDALAAVVMAAVASEVKRQAEASDFKAFVR